MEIAKLLEQRTGKKFLGREGESAPAQPTTRVQQYENRIPCGKCGHVHLGRCPHCNDCPQIVPPAAETAMTAEQLRSEFEKILSPAVNCNAPYAKAMVTMLIKTAEAYAAHVREAAQTNAAVNSELSDLREKWNAAERKLAEVEKALRFVGMMLDVQCQEAGDIDGATIEEWLISCGFYAPTVVTKPCDESEESSCMCAEVGFPTTCNKLTDIAMAALASLRAASKEG